MIKKLPKIESFTLSELVVVMAISIIVVGLAYSAINLLTKNVYVIQNNYSQVTDIQLFEQQLAIDFNTYPKTSYSKFSEKLSFSSPIDSIIYLFESEYVLRNTDTIWIEAKEKELFFKGEIVEKGSVDAIKIIGSNELQNKGFFIFRRNDGLTRLDNGN